MMMVIRTAVDDSGRHATSDMASAAVAPGAHAGRPQAAHAMMLSQRRVFFLAGVVALPLQKSMICLAANAWVAATWRLAAAVAWPRAEPAARFAALSQMLMAGFFVVHGLRMPDLPLHDHLGRRTEPGGARPS